jgi:hypothetical protein
MTEHRPNQDLSKEHRPKEHCPHQPSHHGSPDAEPDPAARAGAWLGPCGEPDGDVVPGDPPVPITVWYLPQPAKGSVVSAAYVRRLTANYARPGAVVVDLTAARTCGRQSGPVDLLITSWPVGAGIGADRHFADCVAQLVPGGCLAVVLPVTQTPGHLAELVTAARSAGLRYLQHIVVAHQLSSVATPGHVVDPGARRERPSEFRSGPTGQPRWTPHHRVHSDVLLFLRPVFLLPGDA